MKARDIIVRLMANRGVKNASEASQTLQLDRRPGYPGGVGETFCHPVEQLRTYG